MIGNAICGSFSKRVAYQVHQFEKFLIHRRIKTCDSLAIDHGTSNRKGVQPSIIKDPIRISEKIIHEYDGSLEHSTLVVLQKKGQEIRKGTKADGLLGLLNLEMLLVQRLRVEIPGHHHPFLPP